MKRLISACLLATSVVWLAHFITVAVYGEIVVSEPNPIFLGLEVAGFLILISIALIGLSNASKD